MKENFSEYMAYYKGLPLKEKQGIIVEQLNMLNSLAQKMCKEIGAENELITYDINNLEEDSYSEDEFAENVIILVNSIQNSICDFSIKLAEINDNI